MWQDDICFGQSVGKKFNSAIGGRTIENSDIITK